MCVKNSRRHLQLCNCSPPLYMDSALKVGGWPRIARLQTLFVVFDLQISARKRVKEIEATPQVPHTKKTQLLLLRLALVSKRAALYLRRGWMKPDPLTNFLSLSTDKASAVPGCYLFISQAAKRGHLISCVKCH